MNLERTVPPHRTDPIMGLSMQIGNWTSPMKGRLSVSTFKGVGDGPSVRDEYKVCVTPVHFNDPSIHRECIPWCFSGIIHVLYQNTVVCNRKIRDIGNYFTISTVFYTCILYNTSWCTCNWSCMLVEVWNVNMNHFYSISVVIHWYN